MYTEFDKIIGYKEIKKELEMVADSIINRAKYKELRIKPIQGLLLYGTVGVGKTLMAECLIKATKKECYTIKRDRADGDFINYIRCTFEKAVKMASDDNGTIVFLDDLDKFADCDGECENQEAFITVQTCIDNIKDKNVFVVATVNNIEFLPNSLIRKGRFDKILEVHNPNKRDAVDIVKYYLSNKPYLADDIDCMEIARLLDGKSCAVLESILNEACSLSIFKGKEKVDMNDMIEVILKELFNGTPTEFISESKYLREVAVHECGHAVISEYLESGSTTLISVKEHDGNINGITLFNQAEEYFNDIKYAENRVVALLGGKAAVEVVLGKTDCGCSDDIRRAWNICSRFVDDYCSYGFGSYAHSCASEYREKVKEDTVSLKMEEYYQIAKRIIINNRELLDKLVDELCAKKTLTQRDIKRISDGVIE